MNRKVLRLVNIYLCAMLAVLCGCQIKSDANESLVAASGLECQLSLHENELIVEKNDENLDFSEWQNIKGISASSFFLGGIKDNGTVVTTSYFNSELDTSEWKDINMLEFTLSSAYGLKKDGTVMFSAIQESEIDNIINKKVSSWTDIKYIDTANFGIVGVQNNGKVVAALYSVTDIEEKVKQWEDIKMVSISTLGLRARIVGLKNNGEIVEAQSEELYRYHLDSYEELKGAVKICAGDLFTAGLMADGTLRVKCGDDYEQQIKNRQEGVEYIDLEELDSLTDVLDINSFEDTLVILKRDGTVLVAGVSGD